MAQKSNLKGIRRLGYCSGIITESLQYNMFYTFYLVFLTDIVKLQPAFASTISLIAILWDAFTDPIIGYYADKGNGKKKSFMVKALFPMFLAFVGMFAPLGNISNGFKFAFYASMTIIFWLSYTYYTIPYYAIVAEITGDYDERTAIRGESSLINILAIAGGTILPDLLPALFIGLGAATAMGWTLTAAVIAGIAFIFGVITAVSLKSVELVKQAPLEEAYGDAKGFTDIFKSFAQVLKLKSFKSFTLFVFFFLMSSSMLQTNIVYLIKDVVGVDDTKYMPIFMVVFGLTMGVVTPIVTKFAQKYDRRITCIVAFSITCVGLIISKIVGISNLVMMFIQPVLMGIAGGAFWTLFYSMAYDLTEVDEFTSGKRRESIITAFPQFFQKFGSAIGMWIAGLVLQFVGYNAELEVQAESTRNGIENISTLIPALLVTVSIIGLILYPITKKRFNALSAALEKKRVGEEYSTEGFEKLL